MSRLCDLEEPGYLWVQSQPKPGCENEYNEWYNTEHGPLRMKLDFFLNGYRYRSTEDPSIYLAIYDLKKICGLEEPRYTTLREKRSQREQELINHKLNLLDRRVYSNISSRGHVEGPPPVTMQVAFVVKDEHVDELHRWYEEEHTPDLMKIPGWLRSRRYKLVESDDQQQGHTELLAVHDFAAVNDLDGKEHQEAKSRPWRNRVLGLLESRKNQRYEFCHEFNVSDYRAPPSMVNGMTANDLTTNLKASSPRVDGPSSWRFDGSSDPNASVVVFSNSLLTDLHLWDHTVSELTKLYPHLRFLRYNTRGYESKARATVTVDVLTNDLAHLLDFLKIEKVFAVIGVSLGGITTLNFAIKYPSRLSRFIACDCNVSSSEKNTAAWHARIALAHEESGWEKLAQQTMERWFTPESVNSEAPGPLAAKKMILAASKPGFESCTNALCTVDIADGLKSLTTPGMCVVGEKDGVLPDTMAKFSKDIPQCTVSTIKGSGHLPMLEKPSEFVQAILPIFELRLTG